MLSEVQQKNYEFFTQQLPEYLKNPILKNKFGIFFDEELKGVYDSFETAFEAACAQLPVGEFVVQQIMDSNEIVEFLRSAVV